MIAGLTILAIGALFLYRWNKRNNAAIQGHARKGNSNPSELGDGEGRVHAHVADKDRPSYGGMVQSASEGGWGQSPTSAGGYGAGAGQYYELSNPENESEKARQPQELMASPGREPAELGDGRKSALSG